MRKMPGASMFPCHLCGRAARMDRHLEGRTLRHYEMFVCNSCFESNWDGFPPHLEAAFVRHLNDRNIPLPQRNENGRYPLHPR